MLLEQWVREYGATMTYKGFFSVRTISSSMGVALDRNTM